MENYKSVNNWKPRKEFTKMTDEKILKKIGKLLSLYGVDEEEKAKFLADVQDAKYDEEEVVEEVVKEDEVATTDETPVVEEEKEEVIDEELPADDEQPLVEQEPEVDYKAKYEELKGVIDGLVARIEPLENIVAKLGVPDKDEPFGVETQAESEKDESLSYFDEINRRRTGRN